MKIVLFPIREFNSRNGFGISLFIAPSIKQATFSSSGFQYAIIDSYHTAMRIIASLIIAFLRANLMGVI
jgi:hypothetical protein